MKRTKSTLYLLILLTGLVPGGCTRVIDLKLGNDSGRLVVEGNVTNGSGNQSIVLSRNVPFTNTNVYPVVSGAIVTVTGPAGVPFVFAEGPAGTYTNNLLTGVSGNTYTLNINSGGQVYTSGSTMPGLVTLDSLSTRNGAFKTANKQVLVYFKDPAGIANQYRFVLRVNGTEVKEVFVSSDTFSDGKNVSQGLYQGDVDVHSGDTVRVEMQCIDPAVYLYFNTLAQQQQRGPGGGVTPSDPPANISPAVLGYFSAHTSQVKTLIVR